MSVTRYGHEKCIGYSGNLGLDEILLIMVEQMSVEYGKHIWL